MMQRLMILASVLILLAVLARVVLGSDPAPAVTAVPGGIVAPLGEEAALIPPGPEATPAPTPERTVEIPAAAVQEQPSPLDRARARLETGAPNLLAYLEAELAAREDAGLPRSAAVAMALQATTGQAVALSADRIDDATLSRILSDQAMLAGAIANDPTACRVLLSSPDDFVVQAASGAVPGVDPDAVLSMTVDMLERAVAAAGGPPREIGVVLDSDFDGVLDIAFSRGLTDAGLNSIADPQLLAPDCGAFALYLQAVAEQPGVEGARARFATFTGQ